MDKVLQAKELRRALQMYVQGNITEESEMMAVASIYPSWEDLLATKKQYPAKTVFKWGENADGETQLWSFLADYTPQAIYMPDKDISHYKKVGVTEAGVAIWTQPLSAEDAYEKGDVVSHRGKRWNSDFEGKNGWEEEPETH